MITVNGDVLKHRPGMTVRDLLNERGYSASLLLVRIDGTSIARADFDRARVPDGAEVQVVPLMSGG